MHCVSKVLSNQLDCDSFDEHLRRIIQRFDTFRFHFFITLQIVILPLSIEICELTPKLVQTHDFFQYTCIEHYFFVPTQPDSSLSCCKYTCYYKADHLNT